MAGTYLSVVEGFGGMRLKNNLIHFDPFIPNNWNMYSFIVKHRDSLIKVEVTKEKVKVFNQGIDTTKVYVKGVEYNIQRKDSIEFFCS